MILVLSVFLIPSATATAEDTAHSTEYQLKTAFMYNFMKFIKWPEPAPPDNQQQTDSVPEAEKDTAKKPKPVIIGILGKDPFGEDIDPLEKRTVQNQPIIIKRFTGLAEFKRNAENKQTYLQDYSKKYKDDITQCKVLFISSSESEHFEQILKMIAGSGILTISETAGFIEKGGIINFLTAEQKVRFEVNTVAAEKEKLQISSQLLRLAIKVLTNEKKNKNPKDNSSK